MQARVRQALTDVVAGAVSYLTQVQEQDGRYGGSFWSELAYHGPLLDYHAGGSHHHRTVGTGGLALLKAARLCGQTDLRDRAERAFDWVVTQQHEDGGLLEITNNEQPSQFHLEHERSSISLALVCHGLYAGISRFGLPKKPSYICFLERAAAWQMSVEPTPGNFLHSEGYPVSFTVLNACAHATETLLVGARMSASPTNRERWEEGAARAIRSVLDGQTETGMYPYRVPDPGHETLSYTATCIWVLRNMLAENLTAEPQIALSLERACELLASRVDSTGRMMWEGHETHGQVHHSWVYGMVAQCLYLDGRTWCQDAASRLILFLRNELYDPGQRLVRVYDFPLGEARTIQGRSRRAGPDCRCAYNQADMVDCLLDICLAEGMELG